MSVQIINADALTALRTLPAESVQLVCTSPPYFGLRAYGTNPQVWGGDPEHGHIWSESAIKTHQPNTSGSSTLNPCPAKDNRVERGHGEIRQSVCPCGAWRGELGLEPTPALFIEHLVTIFEEVRRVLRPDGLVFCNLGDSYHNARTGGMPGQTVHAGEQRAKPTDTPGHRRPIAGIPQKSLMLIPERFAIAMQDAGWIVRSQIVWAKTSAMPESVKDRPTSAWEPIWMFAKSRTYFYDADAVRQPNTSESIRTSQYRWSPSDKGLDPSRGDAATLDRFANAAGANLRNVWTLSPEPSREQHYASFPTEIPRRCIKAATSERGQCRECGAPWVRVVEREPDNTGYRNGPGGTKHRANPDRNESRSPGTLSEVARYRTETLGWAPSCRCDAGPPVPQTVLDPFAGTGTTGLVADQLGRHAVLIELNESYCRMAEARIQRDAGPMFSDAVEVVTPTQTTMFDVEAAG